MQSSTVRSRLSEMPRQYPTCWRCWPTSRPDFRSSSLDIDHERVRLAGLSFMALQDIGMDRTSGPNKPQRIILFTAASPLARVLSKSALDTVDCEAQGRGRSSALPVRLS